MRPSRTFMASCCAIAFALPALWAPAGAQSRPDPADPAAPVPAAAYRSPFAGYRPLGDEAVGSWRAANDEVGRIGGWREYAREAQAPGVTPEESGRPPSKASPAPIPKSGHDAHKMSGAKP